MDKISAYNYIRSKFVELKETRALIKKHGLKIKYGYLSDEETRTVRHIVDKFLKERRLTMSDLKRHLVEDVEFPIHDLLYECTQVCELRTYKSIHTHLSYMCHPYIHINWNADEEVQLLDLVNQKGFKWKEISYHLSKYKDLCRTKYLILKGENSRALTKSRIENLLANMPSTDQEWAVICNELRVNKLYICKVIKRYLNGKELNRSESKLMEIHLCLLVLNNNHYCKFNCNIENILAYLESDVESYGIVDKIDGNATPFISKNGKRAGSVLVDGVFERPYENTANTDREYPEDDFEALLDDIKKESSENRSQTRFLNQFLDFFKINKDFDLNIKINKEDIFWYNVTRDINLEKCVAFSKFSQLSKVYGWRIFNDVYDTAVKLAYDHVMTRIKQTLVDKNTKESKMNSDAILDQDIKELKMDSNTILDQDIKRSKSVNNTEILVADTNELVINEDLTNEDATNEDANK